MSVESRIYDEAVRLITAQEDELDGLRARVGMLLAAASLITTFLGSQALSRGQVVHVVQGHAIFEAQFTRLTWVAVGLFVAVAASALLIFWPWTWYFGLSPRILIEDHVEENETPADAFDTYLARVHERNWDRNAVQLKRLLWVWRFATVCLAGEVIAWVTSLGTS